MKEFDLLHQLLISSKEYSFGWPENLDFNYQTLYPLLDFHINNVGQPFSDTHFKMATRGFEREVIHFFSELYQLALEDFSSGDNTGFGYVTSGGTEGNMYGIFLGRETYPDGILYYSADTHYSITKIAIILRMQQQVIGSLENGEIDYESLANAIQYNKDKPVILNMNIGSTMKGAIDNIDKILEIFKQHNITRYYIHCDAALFGMMLPFMKNSPQVNFTHPIGSIAISGHKFIGSPMPCGVVIAKANFVKNIANRYIEYVGARDITIAGSRSGHTPLFLWYAIKTKGYKGFQVEVETCIQIAKYLYNKLTAINYPCMLNIFSNIVVFKKPSTLFIRKWSLAVQGNWAHVIVMQHITKEKIDEFFDELKLESLQPVMDDEQPLLT
jgi:histidine decarboxylase